MREVPAHVSRGRVSARGERGASVVARDRAAEPSGTDRGDRRGVHVRAACERAALSRSATALAGESGVRPRSPRSEGRIDRVEAASFIRMRRSRHARRRHEDTAIGPCRIFCPCTGPLRRCPCRTPGAHLLRMEMETPLRGRRVEIRDPARSTRPLRDAPDEPSSTRRTETSVDLMGSGRGRRHPHRRARSASPCGVSRGPRVCRVRVPIVLTRRRTWRRQNSRSRRSIGIPSGTPGDAASTSERSAHWRAISAHSRR